jgi:putative DNA primase/helicase
MSGPDLREIVRRIGAGEIYANGRAAVVPGPGHSLRDRSLSLRLSDDNERVFFHSFADDPCREVMLHLGLEARHSQEASGEERRRQQKLRDEEARRRRAEDQAFCSAMWAQTEPLEGSLAESYLWSRRLVIEDCPDIRFHPAAPRAKPRPANDPRPLPTPHPAMLAAVRDRNGASMGIHATYVALDGRGKAFGPKHSRLMFGPMRGGCVHLAPAGRVLGVGEGIETCLAYRARTGVPVWAALTTSQYATLQLPTIVRELVIAADGDPGGLTAAQGLAERACKIADVRIDPAPDGQDWADVWSAANV